MIRMRENSKRNSKCCNCGQERDKVLMMFDLKIGDRILTICDECNTLVLNKTLAAEVRKNAKIKTPKDMRIIRARAQKTKGIAPWAGKQ